MSSNDRHKISVMVNGKVMSLDNDVSVLDLLQLLEINNRRYVVVINDEVTPKSMHGMMELKQSDRCDIMSPISGA
ncbi:MAG: sulfur carrier protein ThiS [Pseudomonadota bacterium]|nr:sulfur carrier protein ThiS [Pseudomonadota bacterium]